MNIILTEYQENLIYEIINGEEKGKLLWWEMGTGKTIATLGIIKNLSNFSIAIFLPRYLKNVWIKEAKKTKLNINKINFYFYEELNLIDNYIDSLKGKVLIFDEVHNFFPNVSRFQIKMSKIMEMSKNAEKIIALSGTPINNKISDICPLINFIACKEIVPFNKHEFDNKYFEIDKNKSLFTGWFLPIITMPMLVTNIAMNMIKNKQYQKYVFLLLLAVFYIYMYRVENMDLKYFNYKKFLNKIQNYVSYYKPEYDKLNKDNYPTIEIELVEIYYSDYQINLLSEFFYNATSFENLKKIDFTDVEEVKYYSEKINREKFIEKSVLIGNLAYPGEFSEKIKRMTEIAKNKRAVFYSKSYESGSKLLMDYFDKLSIPYLYLEDKITEKEMSSILEKFKNNTIFLVLHKSYIEGVSIHGAEQLHIMEQPDNYSSRSQLIGRVKRLHSHSHLPKNQRHVDVYEWICVKKKMSIESLNVLFKDVLYDIKNWYKYKNEVFYLNQLAKEDSLYMADTPDKILYSNNIGIAKLAENISFNNNLKKKCCIDFFSKEQEKKCMETIGVKCKKYSKRLNTLSLNKKSPKTSKKSKKSKKKSKYIL